MNLETPQTEGPARGEARPSDDGALARLLAALDGGKSADVTGVSGGARGLLARQLLRRGQGPIVAVAADEDAADLLERDLRFFLGEGEAQDAPTLLRLPVDDELPYDEFSPDRSLELARLRTIFLLAQRGLGKQPAALVVSARALARKLMPRTVLDASAELLGKGVEVGRDALARKLVGLGYAHVPLVEDPGTFSVRGAIVDLFSPIYQRPARLEFFGEEIESLRLFDPESQRTLALLDELYVSPAREILFTDETKQAAIAALREAADEVNLPSKRLRELVEPIQQAHLAQGIHGLFPGFYGGKLSTLLDYLPKNALFFLDDPEAIDRELSLLRDELRRQLADARARGEIALPPEQHFAEPMPLLEGRRALRAHRLWLSGSQGAPEPIRFSFGETGSLRKAIVEHHGEAGALTPLVGRLEVWRESGVAGAIACHSGAQAERLKRLLLDRRLMVKLHAGSFDHAREPLYDPAVHAHLFVGELSQGFVDGPSGLAVVADEEIFGPQARREAKQRRPEQPFIDAFRELNEGDLVVHIDHGIARYGGLVRMDIRGIDQDFMLLQYDGADKLYLPVTRLRQVQKFQGADPTLVRLDKLGGQGWLKTKAKVKEELLRMAAELLDIYAAREAHPRPSYSPPDPYFRQFEADFPFEETPDQARAIDDVLRDLGRSRPMDRLVCGDVGFGKTEVALRAAFKVVMDKRQVAVLVPTTVLAAQHFRTFQERFKDYPVRVEMLSRLRDAQESRKILEDLAAGRVDVVIGTHKLLGKEVAFKDLGLAVVDEEQRFGVGQKERLKKLRKLVDVLTLTATPIPRTLHMSMAGIRDLSIIATPPEDRRAIRTFVQRFEPGVIKEAIDREVARGGQLFFVHNRVRSIAAMEKFLRELVPTLRIAVAHGQMEEHLLDRVMSEFIDRKHDLLLCTAIIEAGLDIPSANTMIVSRADTFGLAQLYQLRGRVGRSKERAYCHLLIPRRRQITKDASRRLEALQEFTELGSGFRIASHDLEIRGAGNLLGPDQSGTIAAVGFDLYSQLMDEAVREIRGEAPREEVEPDISLPVSALLPEDLLPDVHQRLHFYKKLAQAQTDDEIDDIRGELRDRCGELPLEVDFLTAETSLKIALRQLGLRGLESGPGRLVVAMGPKPRIDGAKLAAKVQKSKGAMRLTPDMKLVLRLEGAPQGHDLLEAARRLLGELSTCATA
ncbi:MAG: transcription-repair coupling factor [Deltaproteobacteria bacterium]